MFKCVKTRHIKKDYLEEDLSGDSNTLKMSKGSLSGRKGHVICQLVLKTQRILRNVQQVICPK